MAFLHAKPSDVLCYVIPSAIYPSVGEQSCLSPVENTLGARVPQFLIANTLLSDFYHWTVFPIWVNLFYHAYMVKTSLCFLVLSTYPFCFCYHTVPLLFWVLQTILMRNYKYTLNTACTDIFMYLHAKQIIHLMFFIWSKHNYSLHGYICDFTTKSCMIVTVIAFSFLKHAGNSYLNKLHKLCIK